MDSSNRYRPLFVILLILMSVMIARSMVLALWLADGSITILPGRGTHVIFNASILISCLIMCLILFVSILLDHQHDTSTRWFMILVTTTSILLFSSLEYCIFHHTNIDKMDSNIFDCLFFLMYIVMIASFTSYQRCFIQDPPKLFNRIYYTLIAGAAIFVVLCLFSSLFGIIDVIQKGISDLSRLSLFLIAPITVLVLLSLAISILYVPTRNIRVVMCVTVIVPFAVLLSNYPDSITTAFVANILMMYFLYGNTYLEKGAALSKNKAELEEQKVALMTSRIEPEFLCESLEAIAKMEGTPYVARRELILFKQYFEKNLSTIESRTPIPITEELEHIKTYLTLEKLRFKEKLNVKMDIRDLSFSVPAMSIQMLVENAVKHGITKNPDGGTVMISTVEFKTFHRVIVKDNGVGFDTDAPLSDERSHIGLKNMEKRMTEMMNGTVKVRSVVGKGTTIIIRIPKDE